MDVAVESAYHESENEEEDIFGDSVQPASAAEDEEMDLFGEEARPAASTLESERLSSAEPAGTREGSEAFSASELKHRKDMEYEEDDNQEANVQEVKHAILSIPNIPLPRGSDGKTWVIRMPNYVKVDSRPFSKETYTGPENSIDGAEDRERSMLTKLEVENTVRWKWTKDDFGIDRRQSNSRIIRWSDGSLSLLLGKELFDINQSADSGPRPAASMSQSQSQSGNLSQSQSTARLQEHRSAGLTYLVAQHKRSYVLQAEAPIAGTMTLRPTGMQSEAHRKLAKAVGQKHSRVSRLRMAPDSIAQEQAEAERAEKKVKRPRKSAADKDELGGFGRRKRSSYSRRRESVWSDDEEPPEDWAEDDEGEFSSPSQKRKNSGEGRNEGGRAGGDYQTDDFLVADSSEDDEGSTKKKKSRKSRDEEDGGADALDEIDAKIAEQEAKRKRQRETEGGDEADTRDAARKRPSTDADDVEMDVESEDEEEFNVMRRAGVGKKRAVAIEDDDED